MRASGRGGRQGPRGDRLPRGPLLRLRGVYARGLFCVPGGRRFLHAGPFLVQGERMLFRLLSTSTRDGARMRFVDAVGMRNAKPWITVFLGRLRTCALRGGGRLRRSLFHCDAHCFASSFHSSGKYGVSCTFRIH